VSTKSQRSRKLVSVVVPCFNEQEVISFTHQRLVDVLQSRDDFELEIVYVDDGSSDETARILSRLSDTYDRVTVVTLTRNFGHQAAVTAGLQHAAGDAVVVIDADLQDPPEVILKMIESWRAGHEIVYGIRTKRRETLLKRVSYTAFYRLLRSLSNVDVPKDSGDFALLDRRAVDLLNSLPERVRFVRGLRAWIGLAQIGIPYERPPRAGGQSKYSARDLTKLAVDGILSLSSKPLSLIFTLGVISSVGSVVGFILYLLAAVSDIQIFGRSPTDVPGFTSIVLLLLLLSGIQLVSIGLIGAYIGRVYDETKGRPTYLVREIKRGRLL
jgi:polyisoprenyl-phosphate glycosyltransferase